MRLRQNVSFWTSTRWPPRPPQTRRMLCQTQAGCSGQQTKYAGNGRIDAVVKVAKDSLVAVASSSIKRSSRPLSSGYKTFNFCISKTRGSIYVTAKPWVWKATKEYRSFWQDKRGRQKSMHTRGCRRGAKVLQYWQNSATGAAFHRL